MAKILLIDDDFEFVSMMQLMLSLHNFEIDTAYSGEEGLKKIQSNGYDVVILDVMMPNMSGFEVCREIRKVKESFQLPIILLTAKGEKDDIIEGINCGANDYITKPFESEILIAKINALVKLKELQDELEKKNRLLENLAITDGLTGVYNYRFFHQKLKEEFERAKRYETPLACIMIDLDFFKNINDKYGHMVGDSVLVELASKIIENIRKNDIFARYGGEEFVLLLPHTSENGAYNEAERIRKAIENHSFNHVDQGEIKISLGIANYPSDFIKTPDELLKFADDALYKAKKNGRNRTEVFLGEDV